MSASAFRPRGTRLVLGLLIGSVSIEFFHRQLLAIALPQIASEFALSDTQQGNLLLAFAAAYLVCALGLGQLADRTSRSGVLTAAIALWSLATAAGAAVQSYVALLATRMLVGAGQSGSGATGTPLVADYVPADRRGTAMGLLGIGGTLGSFVGLAAGGVLIGSLGWRGLFFWGGVVGLGFAALFRFVVAEPPRGWADGVSGSQEDAARPGLGEVLRTMLGYPSLVQITLGAVLGSMSLMAAAQWGPSFFARVHGLDAATVGLLVAFIALLGTAGPIIGGVLTDRIWPQSPRRAVRMAAACAALAAPVAILGPHIPNPWIAAAALTVSVILGLIYSAQVGLASQALAPLRMRAVTSALINATLTGVGFGLGPAVTGRLSDAFGGDAEGLRMALSLVGSFYLWASVHLFLASKRIEADLARGGGIGP